MKLADLLAGSKTHTLDFFPPTVIANVEKRLADKDGKPIIRCLIRDKQVAAKPEEIVRQLWLEHLVRAYKYDVRRLAVEVPITFGRDTSKRADIVMRRASEAFAVSRIDAEYFQPKYQALLARARKHAVRTRQVLEFAEHCDRGEQPAYFDDGTLAVVTSKHILETGLDYGNFDRTRDSYWNDREFIAARIFKNDVLTYTTGAKVGRTAVYLSDERALASNHVNVLRLREENPVYVAVVMNSLIGRWQTRMIATGSAQVELYPNDIKSFVIPFVDAKTEAAIVSAVRSAHTARARARELLDRAKRAVEIAIEQGEKAALEYLKNEYACGKPAP